MNHPDVKAALHKSIQELMNMPTEEFSRYMKEASQGLDGPFDIPFQDGNIFTDVFSSEFLRET